MLPRHRESEFPALLGQLYSWASSRPARAHAGLGRADILPHAGPLPEMHANRRAHCLGIQRASLRPSDLIYKILYRLATLFRGCAWPTRANSDLWLKSLHSGLLF